MFEIRNIAFSYGKKSVLKDVSFVVSPGETVSVLGQNGAGKTTLMRILATLALPDSGTVLSDGHCVLDNPFEYRRHLGYLPETISLYDDMTVKEYLAYRAMIKGAPKKRIRRRLGDAAESCRVTEFLRHTIRTLPFGIRKRVALADALLLRPKVLLLDDFLSGLDCSMRQAMGEILSQIASFSAVLVTGHEIEDLAQWTTRFVILKDGRAAEVIQASGADRQQLCDHLKASLSGREAGE